MVRAAPPFVMGSRSLRLARLLLILSWLCTAPYRGVFASSAAGFPRSSPQASELIAQGFELLSRNDAAGAEAAFRKAADAQPEVAAAHQGLGLALWAQGQGTAALRELQAATRLNPADADTFYDLGKVAWTLSTGLDMAPAGASTLSASDYQSLAIDSMSKAISLRPQSAEIRLSLAELYLDAGRPQDAVVEAQEAARLASTNPAAHVTLGRALFVRGEEDKAESEFKAALALDSSRGEAHLGLAHLRLFQKRLAEAREEFRRAIRVSPNLAPAYAALGDLLASVGQPAEARALLEKAVALDTRDWRSQYRLGVLLMEAGEASRATQLLQSVTRARPDFLPAREQVGLGLLRRGDLKGAQGQAEALMARSPQAAEGHRLMALVLWKQRDYESSLAECAMALASDPDSAQMLALQAVELWQLNQKKDAQRAFVQAAKAEPKISSAEVMCRMLLCDSRDLGPVGDFLRKNRWVLAPTP